MSNTEHAGHVSVSTDCTAQHGSPQLLHISSREAIVGDDMVIRRALPNPLKRMIGAWCFLDHAGPAEIANKDGLRVGPHPHIGLQTFTWMIEGEVLHRDSLGCVQLIRPGQVNLMTAGRGIVHSEESPAEHPPRLHAAQLWIALPDQYRHINPAFDHYPNLPVLQRDGFSITVLAGDTLGQRSPARIYSPLVGLDFTATGPARTMMPVQPDFEYGVMVMAGSARIEGETLLPGCLLYLGCGRHELHLEVHEPTRFLLLGGEPFNEEILLWWNFVGRTPDDIIAATDAWNTGNGFDKIPNCTGRPLTAPALPDSIKPVA